MAVGRKAELFPRPDVTYWERATLRRGKVEEPHHRTILRIQSAIPDSFGNDSERIGPAKRSRNFDWLAALNRHLPNLSILKGNIVEDLPIRRFHGPPDPCFGDLYGLSAIGRHLPSFVTSGAVTHKVDPVPIVRVAGICIIRWILCQPLWWSAARCNYENVGLSFDSCMERQSLTVG